jgi:hypothetical protein
VCGCFCTPCLSDTPVKVIAGVEMGRIWWSRPSAAKVAREVIAKILIEGIQHCISCMPSHPILLEKCFLKLNIHALEKWEEVFFKDLLIIFSCHCIGEENSINDSYG